MNISATIDYAATPIQVFEMLADEAFQKRKCEATGALNHSVAVTQDAGRTVIVTKRTMPTDSFPDFVKGMVGQTLIVTETDDWGPAQSDGTREGTMTVDLGGGPIALNGTLRLTPNGSGTVQLIDGDLKAKIPIIGSKIEKAAAPAVESAIAVERRVGQAWLAG